MVARRPWPASQWCLLVKTSEKDLLEQYEKAIDNLTIDPANRLKRTIETLKVDKSGIDMLEAKIQKLERKHR